MASDILTAKPAGVAGPGLRARVRGALGFRNFAPIVDAAVKERLTGAIILVALIVLLVPALLTGPLRPAARRAAPPAEVAPLRTYTIDLGDNARAGETPVRTPAPSPTAPSPTAPPPTAAQPPPAPARPVVPAPAPARGPAVKPAAPPTATAHAPAPAARASSGTPGEGWMVQLGSFAHRANAEHLAQQLRARGFQVGVSRATTGRRLYRVRAGPVSNRTEAEQLAAKLRSSGHRGAIVPK